MKYLYKILRLFKCPHKFVIFAEQEILGETWSEEEGIIANEYHLKCKYCGKIKFIRN